MDAFALLDDRDARPGHPSSRLYTGFVREHRCTDPATLPATWAAVQADQAQGLNALLLADYEWGARLLGTARRRGDEQAALRVLMFRDLARLTQAEAGAWLAEPGHEADEPDDTPAGVASLQPSVDRAGFTQAIGRIHEAIAAGETYQVNYTYRLHGRLHGAPRRLYQALRARQPVAYGAYIVLPEGGAVRHVLSCSPELFVRGEAGLVTAKPMKGTAARYTAPEGDSETARLLSLDVKNRAENLMIVDLLRNDLGRIAQTGTVRVPELFAIEPYATVFQMTSTVQALLRPEVDFVDVLRAVFPCGSITGAPKHQTMGLITAIETTPRGLYCGSIGWVDPPRAGQACGDFCLSVAIRTLVLGPSSEGWRPLTLGVGAGIVKDSRADDEFDECRLKARFLTGLDPGFTLFETVLVTAEGELPHLEAHLRRLSRSAGELGFRLDAAAARQRLRQAAGCTGAPGPRRLRLDLHHDGRLVLSEAPLATLGEGPVRVCLASQRLPRHRPLAAHKTSHRGPYDQGVREAERRGAFDSLFFSEGGWLVEGGRTSVFLNLEGNWFTPPVADGALPGVMRAELMQPPRLNAAERRLWPADLQRAQGLILCNALRGALEARLVDPPDDLLS